MPKRVLQGVVVSDKQDKTVVVKVERRFTHPVMKKTVRRTKNYHAHDEANAAKIGDKVLIEESRPHSKLKTWELVSATRPARAPDPRQGEVAVGLRQVARRARLWRVARSLGSPARVESRAALGELLRSERKAGDVEIPVRRSPDGNRARSETGLKRGEGSSHDPDADESRRRRQFRRAPRHVHQGAGRLEAQIRRRRRHHRRVGQGGDPARPREEGRRHEGGRRAHRQGHPRVPTAR